MRNFASFVKKNLEKKIKGGYSVSGFILYRPQWKDKNTSPVAMNNNMNEWQWNSYLPRPSLKTS